MKCLSILLFIIISLNTHSTENNQRKTDCDKIYERVYIDLLVKCFKLNPVKHHEFFCRNQVVKHIKDMIRYCEEQESDTQSTDDWFNE